MTEKDWIDLSVVRLEQMPENLRMCVCDKCYDKYELIEEVKKQSEIGKLIIKVEKNYFKWIRERAL